MATVPAMRAAVLREFGTAPAVEQVPDPVPGPGEVVVAVDACAVDRFDVEICAGTRAGVRLPLIPGHEITGRVAAVGSHVAGWAVGTRVVPGLYLVCGECRRCAEGRETICENFRGHLGVAAPGGYAEYVVVPARNLVALPPEVTSPGAALAANVIGTAFHALTARMQLLAGERIIITGAGGGVGLHAVQLAAHLGAAVLAVDPVEARRRVALEQGATLACGPDDLADAAAEWTGGGGVDAVLELVGPATLDDTVPALRKGGRLVIVGSHSGRRWSLDPHDLYRNEWELRGSRNVSVAELAEAVALVASGAITPLVDSQFPLDEAPTAFRRLEDGAVIGRDVLIP